MADTVDRAVFEVETRRTGDRNAIRGIRDEILSTQQVQRAAQQFDTRYTSTAADGQRRIIQAERERRAGIAEDLRLLSLRVQTANLASSTEVAALRESLLAQRDYQQSTRATEQENLRLLQITQQLERGVGQLASAQSRVNRGMSGLPVERIRMGGNAVSALAFAAEQSALGGRQAVVAFGNLAQTLSFVSQNARFASWAGWIGAAVTVAGTLVALLSRADQLEKQRAERARERDIADLDVHTVDRELRRLEGLKAAAEGQRSILEGINIFGVSAAKVSDLFNLGKWGEIKRIETEIAAVEDRRADLLRDMARSEAARIRENTRALALAERQLRTEHDLLMTSGEQSEHAQSIARIRAETAERETQMAEEFRRQIDPQGHGLALTQEQNAALERNLQLVRDIGVQREAQANRAQIAAQAESSLAFAREIGGVGERFNARLFEIEQLREAEAKLYESSEIAATRAEFRKRQLYRDTAKEAGRTFGQIHDAFINSSSRELKAIAHIADSIRRVQIGAEAALAAVESARQFALVPAALARGAPWAAALHALSGTQLAAAAALGFREALGSGGGGGGGGGGVGAGTTFEPDRGAEGGGATTVNLYTSDPDAPGRIARVTWLMKRGQVLGRQIPPTSGFTNG